MEDYSHDEVPETKWRHLPEVVVKPENISQVSEIMKLANREGSPVTPRGAGTGLAAGAVPFLIIEVDQQNLVMVVEPGVTTGDVQRCARDHGYLYAGDPCSTDSSFIGGTQLPARHKPGQPGRGRPGLPISSPPLEKLTRGGWNVVIITSDHTRLVPSRITLPALLRRIRRTAPECRITILIATGFHRSTTKEEIAIKFGPEITDRETIVNHDCRDKESLVFLGVLPSGAGLHVNRLAREAALLISDGFIEPHFFAGFSGGRKSVLPGIVGERTVVIDAHKQVVAAFAGDPLLAH